MSTIVPVSLTKAHLPELWRVRLTFRNHDVGLTFRNGCASCPNLEITWGHLHNRGMRDSPLENCRTWQPHLKNYMGPGLPSELLAAHLKNCGMLSSPSGIVVQIITWGPSFKILVQWEIIWWWWWWWTILFSALIFNSILYFLLWIVLILQLSYMEWVPIPRTAKDSQRCMKDDDT